MNRIRALREDKDLRQVDVSYATGIDQKTLSNYETGKTQPDANALIRLADFFHVSIDYLVGRSTVSTFAYEEIVMDIENVQMQLNQIKATLLQSNAPIQTLLSRQDVPRQEKKCTEDTV